VLSIGLRGPTKGADVLAIPNSPILKSDHGGRITSRISNDGVAFVLLGRWLYLHPNRLVPSWGFFNNEHPQVKRLARVYATFFIFFGAFAFAAAVLARLRLAPILALAIGVIGAWLLRPRLPKLASGAIDSVVTEKQKLLGKHWKRSLVILAGFAVLLTVFVSFILGDSDVSKMAFAEVQTNAAVKQRLGEPIKRGFFTSGHLQTSGPSGRADLAIPIRGPKEGATVYLVAQKSAGVWKYETLQVAFNGEKERLDLLTEAGSSSASDPK
jgi:hypothetical protein